MSSMPCVPRLWAASAATGLLLLSAPAVAQSLLDAPPGASSCSGCHGPAATSQSIPSLQGRSASDILEAVQAFRGGKREATVMGRIAKGFTDDEMRAIAEWLARGGERTGK